VCLGWVGRWPSRPRGRRVWASPCGGCAGSCARGPAICIGGAGAKGRCESGGGRIVLGPGWARVGRALWAHFSSSGGSSEGEGKSCCGCRSGRSSGSAGISVPLPCLRAELTAVSAIAELHCCKLRGGKAHVGVMLLQMLDEVGTKSEPCRALRYCTWLYMLTVAPVNNEPANY
jgi:hypothetical protein